MAKENLVGLTFGRFLVLEEAKERSTDGRVRWVCKCECGNIKNVRAKHLKNGQVVSCGCYFKDNVNTFGRKEYNTSTKQYKIWTGMMKTSGRCLEWDDYECFLEWFNQHKTNGKMLFRKDFSLPFSPDNCAFVDKNDAFKGAYNGKSNCYTINGETLSISQWAEKYGLKQSTVNHRLSADGSTIEEALLDVKSYHKHRMKLKRQKLRKLASTNNFVYIPFKCFNTLAEKEKMGIYQIKNMVNSKVYIGSAKDIHTRWNGHVNQLNRGKHHSRKLQNSWNKYGGGNFLFEVLEYVEDEALLIEKEQCYIDKHQPYKKGYNICSVADRPTGVTPSAETRKKMSDNSTGKRKINQYSPEGIFIKTWDKIRSAANKLKVDESSVSKCCRGKQKTAAGFMWRYADESNTKEVQA